MINKNKKKTVARWKKSGIAAAALLMIGSSTTVLAAQNSEYVKFLVNGSETSAIESGIKMEMEETVSGGGSAFIVASFEKEDGTAFPENTKAASLELDMKKGASYMVEQRLIEDSTKIEAKFDLDAPGDLDGKVVTIQADALVNGESDEVLAKGPFSLTFKLQDLSDRVDIDLKLSHEEISLTTVYVSPLGVGIEGKRPEEKAEFLPQRSPVVKVRTTAGETFELKWSSTSTTESGFKWQYSPDQNGNSVSFDPSSVDSIEIDGQVVHVN